MGPSSTKLSKAQAPVVPRVAQSWNKNKKMFIFTFCIKTCFWFFGKRDIGLAATAVVVAACLFVFNWKPEKEKNIAEAVF